jgi:hypothetical protein
MALMYASHSRVQPSQETLFLCSSLKVNEDWGTRLGLDILAGNIMWVNEPYAAGKYPDIDFFCDGLGRWLDENKKVEGDMDDGYIGEAPQKVKCPGWASNPTKNQAMQNRLWSRHKSLNGQLKSWAILTSSYPHNLMGHGNVF